MAWYRFPVTWECQGTIAIEANSMEEAEELFEEGFEEFELPSDEEIIPGTFMRSELQPIWKEED